ncbi:MAG: hypothetical protein KDA52_21425 [Planctomycetaceae bacterium]|nr:hypothetical protein [Planctomycetaceae bacterium]
MIFFARPLCILVLLLISEPALHAGDWGAVKGRVVLTGELPEIAPLVAKGDSAVKDAVCTVQEVPDDSLRVDADTHGIADVFVFLKRKPKEIHPDLLAGNEQPLVFDQKGCRFSPHAMIVQTDQTVLVKSDDPTNHNTHTHPAFNPPENFLIQPNNREGVPLKFRLPEPIPMKVTCDLHPWMQAHWLVINHPYAAVTDEKGEFVIEQLPVGKQTFRVWQERAGWISKSLDVEIMADQTVDVPPIAVSVDDLTKD